MFEALGEDLVRRTVDTFVDRIMDDAMIGFHFRGVDRARLKQLEFEHMARVLGATIPYTGRALHSAHKKHDIRMGQFNRRKMILINSMNAHGWPDTVVKMVTEATDNNVHEIVGKENSECGP